MNIKRAKLLLATTPARLTNSVFSVMDEMTQLTVLNNQPRNVGVEITNICNLKCKHCPTGLHESKRLRQIMSLDNFKVIVDKFDKAVIIDLGGNGEPLLVPHLPEMIAYAKSKGFVTRLSTNLNAPIQVVASMLRAGIHEINAGLDGLTEEVYGSIRTNGDWQRAWENLVYIAQWKRWKLFPIVQWQWLPTKQNEIWISAAKERAKEIGVDFWTGQPFFPNGDAFWFDDKMGCDCYPTKYPVVVRENLLSCNEAWSTMNIRVDGSVIACCRLRERGQVVGNILHEDVMDIWNSKAMQEHRKLLIADSKRHCAKCAEGSGK